MRTFVIAAAALFTAACQQQQSTTEGAVDMGPMPVVAGFYDSGEIARTDKEQLTVWFSHELATAIVANATGPDADRLDFDFRSWANDPEIVDIRYAVGQHATQNRSEINTRFTQTGLTGGMNLTWNMCRLPNGEWRIDDIVAVDVHDEPTPGAGEAVTLRALLGLEAPSESPCS
ncbi:MAG TPA: hypothetical protein VEA80_03700 [Vitreimonas sp.]|uniref:hypothetical protein n=1 Tax=Vitreimonas sp. TaxID=3069702 RepID=UPI002D47B02F|nr:hypothetical protein [Vitreimonas sp.]HYD86554.1 hypothetical protein [Vitreimonas sp.]